MPVQQGGRQLGGRVAPGHLLVVPVPRRHEARPGHHLLRLLAPGRALEDHEHVLVHLVEDQAAEHRLVLHDRRAQGDEEGLHRLHHANALRLHLGQLRGEGGRSTQRGPEAVVSRTRLTVPSSQSQPLAPHLPLLVREQGAEGLERRRLVPGAQRAALQRAGDVILARRVPRRPQRRVVGAPLRTPLGRQAGVQLVERGRAPLRHALRREALGAHGLHHGGQQGRDHARAGRGAAPRGRRAQRAHVEAQALQVAQQRHAGGGPRVEERRGAARQHHGHLGQGLGGAAQETHGGADPVRDLVGRRHEQQLLEELAVGLGRLPGQQGVHQRGHAARGLHADLCGGGEIQGPRPPAPRPPHDAEPRARRDAPLRVRVSPVQPLVPRHDAQEALEGVRVGVGPRLVRGVGP